MLWLYFQSLNAVYSIRLDNRNPKEEKGMSAHRHICAALLAIAAAVPGVSRAGGDTVIRDVAVVPMTGDTILERRAVVVRDGRIASIADADSVEIPVGAEVIDGGGAYLIPGLADMHTHLTPFDGDPDHLVLYLAHGVTTVRSMSGTPENLSWRERVKRGGLAGPAVYTSGPVLTGMYGDPYGLRRRVRLFHAGVTALPLLAGLVLYAVAAVSGRRRRGGRPRAERHRLRAAAVSAVAVLALAVAGLVLSRSRIIPFMTAGRFIIRSDYYVSETPFQAARETARQRAAGYDCLKLYDFLTETEYRAAARRASELDFYITGHAPDQIPLETMIECGQQEIAHVDELQSYHWIGYDPEAGARRSAGKAGYRFDYESIPRTVELLGRNGVNIVSTLVVKETMYRLIEDTPGVLAGPEYRLVRPGVLEAWKTVGRNVTSLKDQGAYRRGEMQPFLAGLTRALFRGGVTMAIGTDASVEGIVPGYHLHRELELLVEAGLTPYEALAAGTRNAGAIAGSMGLAGDFGTVETGKRADLVLVERNPLERIGNTRLIIGVMAAGKWYTREELDGMLSRLIASY